MIVLAVTILSGMIGGVLSGVLWCCVFKHPDWDCVTCLGILSLFGAIIGYIVFMRSKP